MTVAAMATAPLAAIPSVMYFERYKKKRIKIPVWWTRVYNIHGTSSTGITCKGKSRQKL
jgi:hypothetical protein